ncbi:hypothetical protein [Parapedobacter defluvii]|uniref:hypothetical protein n=1 Tax=Parapedobacter defluvii TaxID=2045106 RepID=UPI001665D680|nr:hypothetical protein [Parapedobacter defluvii]
MARERQKKSRRKAGLVRASPPDIIALADIWKDQGISLNNLHTDSKLANSR